MTPTTVQWVGWRRRVSCGSRWAGVVTAGDRLGAAAALLKFLHFERGDGEAVVLPAGTSPDSPGAKVFPYYGGRACPPPPAPRPRDDRGPVRLVDDLRRRR